MPIQVTLKNAADDSSTITAGRSNSLVLTITNTGPGDVPLIGGSAVPADRADTGPTAVYLNFAGVLGADASTSFVTTPAGWTACSFDKPTPVLVAALNENTPFLPGMSLHFGVDVAATKPSQGGRVIVDAYHLGAPSSSNGLALDVRPPDLKPLSLLFTLADSADRVLISSPGQPCDNTIRLTISNPSWSDPVVPADVPVGDAKPVFALRCVAANPPGPGALTTPAILEDRVQLGVEERSRSRWRVDKNVQASPAFWILTPLDREVLGTGEAASVQLLLSGVVTEADPGTTLLYLEWTGIPGCEDGGIALPVVKVRQVAVTSFTAEPSVGHFGKDPVQVTFSWTTTHAKRVKLNGRVVQRSQVPANLSSSLELTIREPGDVLLVACGDGVENETEAVVSIVSLGEFLVGRTFSGGSPKHDIRWWAPPHPRSFEVRSTESVTLTSERATYETACAGDFLQWARFPPRDEVSLISRRGFTDQRTYAGTWRIEDGIVHVTTDAGLLQFSVTLEQGRPTLQLVSRGILRVQSYDGPELPPQKLSLA